MHPRLWIPILMFIAGLAMVGVSVASGEADLSLVVIFPVVSGTGGLFLLGTAFVVFAMLLGVAFMTMGQVELAQHQRTLLEDDAGRRPPRGDGAKYGGVVLIGPVPIAFGSDMRTAVIMLIAGVVIAIVALAVILTLLD